MKLQKETKPVSDHGKWYDDACGTAYALELLGERWSLLIVRELMLGARRFSDIRASLPGISAKVLTERLGTLEASGVLIRRQLPQPASGQAYELTDWGYRAEPIIQELGRWAAQSPLLDPTLPMSAVSMMLSLRTMFDPTKARGKRADICFAIGRENFVARLADGALPIARQPLDDAQCTFMVDDAATLVALFYGKADPVTLESTGALRIKGDRAVGLAFASLFELPQR